MFQVYITTYQGFEEILYAEILELGCDASRVQIRKRGVAVSGCKLSDIYRFNYLLRTALRVFLNLDQFRISKVKDLQWKTRKINWHHWFSAEQTFRVDAVVNNSREFNNPKFASQVVKDGIVDCFKNTTGERPDVYIHEPDVIVQVLISKDNVTLSLDSSGDSLHKRGYKTGSFKAPLSEVLSAGIIRSMEFQNGMNIYDPMSGSGTLLTEAYMMAANIPAGKFRSAWSFENWKKFDEDEFLNIREEGAKLEIPFDGKVYYGDQYQANCDLTLQNLQRVGCRNAECVSQDFFRSTKPNEKGILVMNPPYDKRLELADSQLFYKQIGDQFKQEYSGWLGGVFSSNIPALKALGLKPSRRIPLWNGPLEGRLFKYELY